MKYRITVEIPHKKKGWFGFTRTVIEKRTVEVDRKTYKKLKEQEKRNSKNSPYSIEEMMLYDDLFED